MLFRRKFCHQAAAHGVITDAVNLLLLIGLQARSLFMRLRFFTSP